MAVSTFRSKTKFINAMGHTVIKRHHSYTKARFVPPNIIILADRGIPAAFITSTTYDGHVLYTIAHEFGHRWDFHSGLSLSTRMYNQVTKEKCENVLGSVCTGKFYDDPPGPKDGRYGRMNQLENWAESFAAYVYPTNERFDPTLGFPTSPRNKLSEFRTMFIETEISKL
jgi:hypothetical protein